MNLLPDQEKKALRREYWLRLAVVALALAGIAILIGGASLFPSYILSVSKKESREQQLASLQSTPDVQASEEVTRALTVTKEKLSVLAREAQRQYLSEWIVAILEQKGAGISIEGMFIQRKRQEGNVSVTGVADTRTSLRSFVNRLRAAGFFDDVVLPVGDLAKDRDITFSLSLTKTF